MQKDNPNFYIFYISINTKRLKESPRNMKGGKFFSFTQIETTNTNNGATFCQEINKLLNGNKGKLR